MSAGLTVGAVGEGLEGGLALAAAGAFGGSFFLSVAAAGWVAGCLVLGRGTALVKAFSALNVQAKLKTDSPGVSGTTTLTFSFSSWRIDLISLLSPS